MRLSPSFFRCLAALVLVPSALLADDPTELSLAQRTVQRHLAGAIDMLKARDVSALTAAQKAKRAWVIEELTRYRAGGQFPVNYDFAGEAMPYFVDERTGVICAVGHLIAASGRRDLVDRVAAADNNVFVIELATDQELKAWLDEHGLTLAEAARIQAPYIGPGPELGAPQRVVRYNTENTGAIALAATGLLINSFAKPGQESRARTLIGATTGLLALGMGVRSSRNDADKALGFTAAAVGTVSLYSSLAAYGRLRVNERLQLAPVFRRTETEEAGVVLRLSF